jgi:hypothetical protein
MGRVAAILAVPRDMDSAQEKSTGTKHPRAFSGSPTRFIKVLVASAMTLASVAGATSASADPTAPNAPSAASAPSAALSAPNAALSGPALPSGYYTYDAAKASAPSRHHRTFGVSMDVGVPDGAALGIVVRPRFDWLRLGAAVTHNGMAPGLRLGVTIDPIAFPIAPTLTIEGGHYWAGTVPGIQGSPSIGYDYANFHLGLEFGNRATFRFFLRGGASWVDMSAAQALNTTSNASSIGNPSYTGWLAPSAKLGFALYF